jgi:3-methylcrotonyl-CoA carboxylase alpha subunit
LRVAFGEKLPLTQEQIKINGHAFEARIYAEDPDNDFLPVTGKLSFLQPPTETEHVRVDTGVLQGDEVSVYYDPMIAKLIVWDEDRSKALRRLGNALSEYRISGMKTNVDFLYNLATCEPFKQADIDTGFIAKHREKIFHESAQDIAEGVALGALYLVLRQAQRVLACNTAIADPHSPWNFTNAWRLNEPHLHRFNLQFAGQDYPVVVEQIGQGSAASYNITAANKTVCARGKLNGSDLYADIDGHRSRVIVAEYDGAYSLYTQNSALQFGLAKIDLGDEESSHGEGALTAPMNGTIVTLLVEAGSTVKKGDALLVMEAMKMEHTIRAPQDGKVVEFYYAKGNLVAGGAELLAFDENKKQMGEKAESK